MSRVLAWLTGTNPVFEARCRVVADRAMRRRRAITARERAEATALFNRYLAELSLAGRIERIA